ncbi:hypothetical protein [Deinococcus aetherius]|uniref:hypothetical protein n=1 Tax=Deinococcus aetherius TaxID=200252 RepID=UPI00222E8D73|nr:hypothetical protein [Deinococcus aetherius]
MSPQDDALVHTLLGQIPGSERWVQAHALVRGTHILDLHEEGFYPGTPHAQEVFRRLKPHLDAGGLVVTLRSLRNAGYLHHDNMTRKQGHLQLEGRTTGLLGARPAGARVRVSGRVASQRILVSREPPPFHLHF